MLTTKAFSEEVLTRVYEFAWEEYERLPKFFEQVFDVQPSAANGWLLTSDAVMNVKAEWNDTPDDVVSGQLESGYPVQIKVNDLKATIRVEENTIEDMGEGDIDTWARMLGQAAAQSFVEALETYHARFFNKGAWAAGDDIFLNRGRGGINPLDDSTGKFIYDGKAFFATDHPLTASSNSLQNYTASAALSVANLKAELIKFEDTYARDNAYRKIRRQAQILMVPPALQYTAREILESANIPYEATNTINVLSMSGLQLIVNPYLDDSDGWFLGTRRIPGLVSLYHPNYPPTGAMPMPFRIGTPRKTKAGEYTIDLKTRVGAGVRNWRAWHACNIASV